MYKESLLLERDYVIKITNLEVRKSLYQVYESKGQDRFYLNTHTQAYYYQKNIVSEFQ